MADPEHAGQHGSLDAIKTIALFGRSFDVRFELLDERTEFLGNLFGVVLLGGFGDLHHGGLLAFVKRMHNTRNHGRKAVFCLPKFPQLPKTTSGTPVTPHC